MTTSSNKNTLLNGVKAYLFPSVVTLLGMLIWRDVNEMRGDVKALLAQSNIDKTKIENLQKDIEKIENVVFIGKQTAQAYDVFPWFMKLYFKPEEEYRVEKFLKNTIYES